jgi:uncharacterized NAD-dependent epimerase/dehydratase family protein
MPTATTPPFLLFLGDSTTRGEIKTALGLARWRPEACIGEWRLGGPDPEVTTGLPWLDPTAARAAGAKTLVVGCVNAGGFFGPRWIEALQEALVADLDVASGMHQRLGDVPELVARARERGRSLVDVRVPPKGLPVGSGAPRAGHRVLTVGTDCSSGKMWTALTITDELRARGHRATFRATGQTGIFIAGGGMPVDAVVSDFVSGSVETLCPAADPDHWDVIEGQGSLFHPGFAAVSLGLLHGAQAEALVLCHVVGRDSLRGVPYPYPTPDLSECIALHETTARLTCPAARVVAVSLVTSAIADEDAARAICEDTSERLGLPTTDPQRFGVAPIVDALLASERAPR